MKPFHKTFVELFTGQKAIKVMTLRFWGAIISGGIGLIQGINESKAQEAAGEASRDASYANAADILKYAGLNSDLMMGAAMRNVEAILRIGEANAAAIERQYARNMYLYGLQAEEEVRRHVIGEKMTAGTIRAMVGASGLMTNVGTPQAYLASQIHEGITQREFMITKHKETLLSMQMEGEDRASIYRLTASENAAVTMANAEASVGVAMNDALRNADAIRRSGDTAYSTGQSNASSALWGGVANAFSAGLGAYQQYSSVNTPSTSSFNNLTTQGTLSAINSAPNTALQSPFYQPQPTYQSANEWKYTGQLPSWYGA